MISGPKCIVCHIGIPAHIPYVTWIVQAEQRTASDAVVSTNEIPVALFHEGCYQSAQPALNKFLKQLAGQ
jgi:hypothetical protein